MTSYLCIATALCTVLVVSAANASEPSIVAGTVFIPAVSVQAALGQVELTVTIDQGKIGASAILARMT